MHYNWGQTAAKKERGHFKQGTSTKKQRNFDSGQSNNRVVCIASISFESKNFFRRLNKVERSIFENNNQINSTVTTRRWVLLTEWTRSQPGTGLVYEWSMLFLDVVVLECSITQLFEEMLSMQFFEIFKGRQVILEPCRKLKYPIK